MMERDYTQEEKYIKAKKKIQEIKGFYAHLVVTILVIPFLIFINLRFVPEFHWFWFAVFGYNILGLGKDWEERKIREIMNEDNYPKYK